MVWRTARVGEPVLGQVTAEGLRDIAQAVVAEQPRPMDDAHLFSAPRRKVRIVLEGLPGEQSVAEAVSRGPGLESGLPL